MEARTRETMKGLSVTTIRSTRQLVATLSGGQRSRSRSRARCSGTRELVILDEPTAALGVAQTAAGPRPRRAARRSGACRRLDLAQPSRHLCRGAPHHGPAPRPQHRRLRARARPRSRSSSKAITAGVPTKVSGIPGPGRPALSVEHDPPVEAPPPLDPTGLACRRRMTDNLRLGQPGQRAVIVALALIVAGLQPTADNFFTPVNFNNIILQMAGVVSACLRRRLRPPDRRDRPLDLVCGRRRRRRGGAVPAPRAA